MLVCISCNSECSHKDMSKTVIDPSCGARGYTVFECKDCSYSFESDYIAPTAHTLTSSVIEASCEKGGYTFHECNNCDYSYVSDMTPALKHSLSTVIVSPTCTKPGFTSTQCKRCNYSYTADYVSPTEHSLSPKITPASCEKEGYTTYSCSVCSFSYVSDKVSATAHNYISQITAPTCLAQGFTKKTCSVCQKELITDYTNPTGHTYTTTAIRATSSRDGYTLNDCKNCDYSYNSDIIYRYSVFMGAYSDRKEPIAKGIDVSTYNGALDWSSISAQGIDFAIIRAGSSVSGEDTYFKANYNGAKSAGLDVGVYYYVEAQTVEEMIKCAEDFELLLKGKKFEYPVYLDFEDDMLGASLGRDLLTKMCQAFIEKLQADGYFAALYTNNNWLVNYFETEKMTDLYDIWYARYLPAEELAAPVCNGYLAIHRGRNA